MRNHGRHRRTGLSTATHRAESSLVPQERILMSHSSPTPTSGEPHQTTAMPDPASSTSMPNATAPHAGQHPNAPVPYGSAAGTQVVSARNPALHTLASFFIPGLGSMLNGAVVAGLIFLGVSLGAGALTFVMSFIPVIGWLLALLILPFWIGNNIWSMIHAYRSTQRWNAERGIIS